MADVYPDYQSAVEAKIKCANWMETYNVSIPTRPSMNSRHGYYYIGAVFKKLQDIIDQRWVVALSQSIITIRRPITSKKYSNKGETVMTTQNPEIQ